MKTKEEQNKIIKDMIDFGIGFSRTYFDGKEPRIQHLDPMEEYKDQSVKHILIHILSLAQQADRKPNAVKEIIDYCQEQLKQQ